MTTGFGDGENRHGNNRAVLPAGERFPVHGSGDEEPEFFPAAVRGFHLGAEG
jgi:hypothetical protein